MSISINGITKTSANVDITVSGYSYFWFGTSTDGVHYTYTPDLSQNGEYHGSDYSESMTGLSEGRTYYVRVYYSSNISLAEGSWDSSFTTLSGGYYTLTVNPTSVVFNVHPGDFPYFRFVVRTDASPAVYVFDGMDTSQYPSAQEYSYSAFTYTVSGLSPNTSYVANVNESDVTYAGMDYLGSETFTTPSSGAQCYVYTSGGWTPATPYVYTSGGWVQASAKIFDGSGWKG